MYKYLHTTQIVAIKKHLLLGFVICFLLKIKTYDHRSVVPRCANNQQKMAKIQNAKAKRNN